MIPIKTMSRPTTMPQNKIPLSIIIATKNEEANIAQCLAPLSPFSEIIVVDSNSADNTAAISETSGAKVINFTWNKQYPKKRGWILKNIKTKHDWIFFLDADEIITQPLISELRAQFQTEPSAAGFFIKSQYIWQEKPLKHGLQNKKLCLINRSKIEFPTINDLNAKGMGEIEGHYQPTLKAQYKHAHLGTLKQKMLHNSYADKEEWIARHKHYAAWENFMNTNNAWPKEDNPWRNILKTIFRRTPCRPPIAFLHSYILKAGILDGRAGIDFAKSRYDYYKMIKNYK